MGGLGKEDAIDLCHKLGADIGLAGELISEECSTICYGQNRVRGIGMKMHFSIVAA